MPEGRTTFTDLLHGSVEFDNHNQNTKMDTVHYMETKPDLSWNALKWN